MELDDFPTLIILYFHKCSLSFLVLYFASTENCIRKLLKYGKKTGKAGWLKAAALGFTAEGVGPTGTVRKRLPKVQSNMKLNFGLGALSQYNPNSLSDGHEGGSPGT